ncbi:MAG: sialidase family protein [Balneolaceae bacterium]
MKYSHLLFSIILIVIYSSCVNQNDRDSVLDEDTSAIQHLKVYHQEGRFAGWPANNGIWNWGDEILVGFVEAEHQETEGFHTYNRETARNKYARSLDGGVTWAIEDAYDLGQTGRAFDNNLPEELAEEPTILEQPVDDFTDHDFIITFMRDNYHNGPSIFYYSNDRGHQWNGPYHFPDLDTPGVGTRTDYFVESSQELSAFMNVAKENGREGRLIYTRTTDGGVNWELVSWLGDEEPEGFEIMPSTIRLGSNEILSILRARDINPTRDYLKAYRSTDNGQTWNEEANPVFDTGSGGSPPALVKMNDGRLALAYAYRSQYGSRICLRLSSDNGETWSQEIPVRSGDGATRDIGYPRMIQREDGNLVIVYYWNHAAKEEAEPYRYIAVSIVDPEKY